MTMVCDRIAAEVSSWHGVTVHAHRFGGVEFRLGRRELGHVHRNGLVDLPFPIRVRERLVAEGTAEPHHVLPDSGWVSFRIRSDADIDRAIELFRLSYDRRS